MNSVLVLDNVEQAGVDILSSNFEVDVKNGLGADELEKIIGKYDALVVRSQTKVTDQIINAGKKLKVIGRAGVGVDNIDVEAATRKGIIVVNSPDGNTVAAAEHTLALIMSTARFIPAANQSLKNGEWKRKEFTGIELYNKVLGIIGVGRIGSHIARVSKAMGMKLLAYDPYINKNKAEELSLELVDLEQLFAESDFITIHVPLTAETKNLINKNSMKKMKSSVRIINCSRGGIVNEDDLVEALENDVIGGAALDVFAEEPLKDSPLQKVQEKLILTPHLGASTQEAQINVAIDVAEQITAVLKGESVKSAVNLPGMEISQELRPYLGLASKLGSLVAQMNKDLNIKKIDIIYQGELADKTTKALTIAVIKGMLTPILRDTVNFVNAMTVARERGIKVQEINSSEETNYKCLISVKATLETGTSQVIGTVVSDQEERVVQIDDYNISFMPEGKLLLTKNIDKPGMVGKIGTVLGQNNINIARMDLGRNVASHRAIMVINIDENVTESVLREIREMEGIIEINLVEV
jgi:D-3-phosphoglycerate dehydrogenase